MSSPLPSPTSARRVLITGANRGLGWHMAKRYLADGHHVWGSARQNSPAELLALGPAGTIRLDLGDEPSIVAGMAALAQQTDALDLLINCAGIDARDLGAPADNRGPFAFDTTAMANVTRINAAGPMAVTREALPLLRAGSDALVINISSQLGSMQVAARKGRDTAYCVSKAALNMWSVKAASALEPEGIAMIMLHPGWVQTDMGGPSAQLTPDESANAMVDTISSLSLADTGRFLRWDGSDHPW